MHIIIGMMIFLTTMLIIVFLLQVAKAFLYVILFIFLIILLLILIDLKVFIYEDSGEVITMKVFHPLDNELRCRIVEFPAEQLKNFRLKKVLTGYCLDITLESLKKKEVRRVFIISGFESLQIGKLLSSLENSQCRNLS